MPFTATIITLNEARHIEACIASVAWANEILVVDSGSTDGTVALARKSGARVIEHGWPGYAAQKNFAAEQASHDWILSVDADERVTPELTAEIKALLATTPSFAGYRIPRVTFHLGKWIRTTDWYPDYQLRLYDRRRARWKVRKVHESVEVDGPYGKLTNELQHYAYRDVAHHRETIERYTTLAAAEMHASGQSANVLHLTVHPAVAFIRNYLLRRGFLDGRVGFTISKMNAQYVRLKYAKLRALLRNPGTPEPRNSGTPEPRPSTSSGRPESTEGRNRRP